MTIKSILSNILLALMANLLLGNVAYAYLDPGTGSALLQGILAAIAAIAITGKLYWHRLLRFFGLRKPKADSEPENKTEIKENEPS